ncbi:MAG: protein TonB, partial [Sphingobacteriales bacterium]
PKNPKILTSSGFSLLDDAVLAFINQELFMPALQGEDKVISEQFFAFRFELN